MSLNSMRNSFHHSAKWILGVVVVAMLFTAYTGIGSIFGQRRPMRSSAPQTASDVIATVNGQPITRLAYENAYTTEKNQEQMFQQSQFNVLSDGQTHTEALQQVIREQEMVIAAQQAGLTVTDADITKARDTQLPSLRTSLGLPANASIDDINSALSKVSPDTVNDLYPDSSLRDEVLLQKYQTQLKAASVPTDEEMTEFYKSVRTRHILISNKSRPDAQAQSQAQQIIAKIKAGGDFATLAKQYSDDPGTKLKGGDDGFITQQTQYVPEFLNAALALKAGETTPQPILSPQYGYFIIQAVAVKENYPKDYQKNKAMYQQKVSQSLQEKATEAALTKVASSAKVVIKDPMLRAFWTMGQQQAAGPSQAALQTSEVADLKSAAATNTNYSDKALIYAALGLIDGQQKKTTAEVSDLNTALGATEDAQLRIMLGNAYRSTGNTTAALTQFATASQNSYNDSSVHLQLQQIYKSMKQPALAQKEGDLLKQIAKNQQPAMPAGLSMPIKAHAGQSVPLTLAASKHVVAPAKK